jgi:hypothetical protein
MPLQQVDPLSFNQLPFFPLSSGDQLLSIMFAAPSGFANTSGVLPSGEANFLDFNQYELIINKYTSPLTFAQTFNTSRHKSQSIVAPNGLEYYTSKQFIKEPPYYTDSIVLDNDGNLNGFYIQALSSAKNSRDYSINDFSIFNSYVHYDHSGISIIPPFDPRQVTNPLAFALTFNPYNFVSLGTQRFNLYSRQYRK